MFEFLGICLSVDGKLNTHVLPGPIALTTEKLNSENRKLRNGA